MYGLLLVFGDGLLQNLFAASNFWIEPVWGLGGITVLAWETWIQTDLIMDPLPKCHEVGLGFHDSTNRALTHDGG